MLLTKRHMEAAESIIFGEICVQESKDWWAVSDCGLKASLSMLDVCGDLEAIGVAASTGDNSILWKTPLISFQEDCRAQDLLSG